MNLEHGSFGWRCLAGCLAVALMVLGGACGRAGPAQGAADASLAADFEMVKGRWVRPDGGYVLELKALLPANALEAAYFNPKPINVGKASLKKEGGLVKVSVELQDVNYPGSTYDLVYDGEKGLLRGTYFQATQQAEYQIAFERIPCF